MEITARYWDDERSEKDPYTKVSVINAVVEMDAIDFQTREMQQFERFHGTVGKLIKPMVDMAKSAQQIDKTLKDKGRVETAYAVAFGGKVFAAGGGVNIPIGNVTEEAILGGYEYRTDQTGDATFSSEKEAVQALITQAMLRGQVKEGNEGQAEKEESEEKGDQPA